jgi:hypothetical protein
MRARYVNFSLGFTSFSFKMTKTSRYVVGKTTVQYVPKGRKARREQERKDKKDKAAYLRELMKQKDLGICPTCFKNQQRRRCCTNLVLLMPEKVLVCCYLGDKHSISDQAFNKKIRELKDKQ